MASKKAAPAAAAPAAPAKKGKIPVDDNCSLKGADVHEDYDCILNQTNIGANNNKFYVIQLLESDKGGQYFTWNRWVRRTQAASTERRRLTRVLCCCCCCFS